MASIDRDKLGEYLSAYLDGELGEPERAALERLLARNRQARTQLEELRQTVELVRGLPRRAAPASL
ncbi:MAG: anti-sigma factor family protein, partial [Planctomycetota bacterium]